MNQAFSRSLNAVLATTRDSLIAQVAADTQIALETNADAMNTIIKAMETASAGVTDNRPVQELSPKPMVMQTRDNLNSFQASLTFSAISFLADSKNFQFAVDMLNYNSNSRN